MKNKVLKAIAVVGGVMFLIGAGGANSENISIPVAMCVVGSILVGIILYANIDYLERRYGHGGVIETEQPPELIYPIDEPERLFRDYNFDLHPYRYGCSLHSVVEVEVKDENSI